MDKIPHVVIIGGGFAGLHVANGLRKAPVRVTLIDRRNHHVFQPLLYQVATAALNPSDIASPIRGILRHQKNASVMLGEVTGFDLPGKRVLLAEGAPVPYDFCILATGVTHSYFGNDEWAKHAPGLKSIEDALEICRKSLLSFEKAEKEDHADHRREWLTFTVIGAGPTGVELAGALGEISRHTLSRDFRRIDPGSARVVLIEAQDQILPGYPPELARKAQAQLEKIGVEVRLKTRVTGVDERGVDLGAERIGSRTVLWAAGVKASPLGKALGVPLDRAGKVLVRPDLTVPGHPEVFVIGDLAALEDRGKWVPGVARAAMDEGDHTAKNIRRALRGEPLEVFHYHDKGSMATIGRAAAVANLPFGIRLSGLPAWLAWLLIHVMFLIGFRNRIMVSMQWAWAYLTHERGARLITGEVGRLHEEEAEEHTHAHKSNGPVPLARVARG